MKNRHFETPLNPLSILILVFGAVAIFVIVAFNYLVSHNPILNGSVEGAYVLRNGLNPEDGPYYYKPGSAWTANAEDAQPAWLVIDADGFANILTGTYAGNRWAWENEDGREVIPQFSSFKAFRYLPFTFGFGEKPKIPVISATAELGITYNAYKEVSWRLDEGEQVFPCIVSPDHKVYAINSVCIVEPELDMDAISAQQAEYDGCDWDVFFADAERGEEPIYTIPAGGKWALIRHTYSGLEAITSEGRPTLPPFLGENPDGAGSCENYRGAMWCYLVPKDFPTTDEWCEHEVKGIDSNLWKPLTEIGPLEAVKPVRNTNLSCVVASTVSE